MPEPDQASAHKLAEKPGPWVDLGLTLPVFLIYHLGVVFMNVRNASDLVTGALLSITEGDKTLYVIITAGIGITLAGVFGWLGRGQTFRPWKFAQIAIEGVVYALVMRLAGGFVDAHLFMGKVTLTGFGGFVMSMGAGFYEELTYRVLLFALVGKLGQMFLLKQASKTKRIVVGVSWGIACATLFSAVHYIGPLGDDFQIRSFVFRWVLGLVLTVIYWARGFAAAVWAHALYDAWVLVL